MFALFQIIQLLRRHRVLTAATLAEELEISERTVYRDIRDLVHSGGSVAPAFARAASGVEVERR